MNFFERWSSVAWVVLLVAGATCSSTLRAATLSDAGGTTLTITLSAGENLTLVSNGATYTFTTDTTFTDGGLANAAGDFTAFGTTTIDLTASGITRYNDIDIVDAGGSATVTFGDSSGNSFSENIDVNLNAGASGVITISAAVSISGNLTVFADTINIGADITTSTDQQFNGPVTLTANVSLFSTSGSNAINFNSDVRSDAVSPRNLIIDNGGTVHFGGTVGGGGRPLGVLDHENNPDLITTDADITAAVLRIDGRLEIQSNCTLVGTTSVRFVTNVDSQAGENNDLIINSPFTEFRGSFGFTTPLGSVTTDAGGTIEFAGGTVSPSAFYITTGSQSFGDAAIMAGTTRIHDFRSTGGGDITFDSTVNSESGEVNPVLVRASGTVTFNGAVGSTDALADVTITADNVALNAGFNVDTNIVTIQPLTATREISLGTEVGGSLSLTDTEFDMITAGILRVGGATAGDITINAAISPANCSTLSLITGDAIRDGLTDGPDISIANLSLQSVNGVADSGGNVIIDTNIDTLAALNTTSGGISILEHASGGDLTVGTVDGVVGVRNEAFTGSAPNLGIQVETNDGNLTINNDVYNLRKGIFLVAQENGNGDFTFDNNATITNANSGSRGIDIRANNMTLEGGTIDGTGTDVMLRDERGAELKNITLGGADLTDTLGLTDAELDTVTTTGMLIIGGGGTGVIFSSAAVSPANATSMRLITGGTIFDSNGNVVNITVDTLDIVADDGFNLDLSVTNLTADTSGNNSGQILNEADSLTTTALNAGAGTINLNAGTFLLDNSAAPADTVTTPFLIVQSGATLAGTGNVTGNIVALAGGTASPGVSPGSLRATNLTFNAGSIFVAEIDGTTPGTEYDQLVATGDVDLGDSTLNVSSTYTPAIGDTLVLIDNQGANAVTGTFNSLDEGEIIMLNGFEAQITYQGGDGNDVVLSYILIDYGDAPDPTYPTLLASDGARHLLGSGLYLGAGVDYETDGLPNATASGDDADQIDDEDGVSFTSSSLPGETTTLDVTASAPGLLNAWVDFNADGDWDDLGEQVFVDTAVATGLNPLNFDVPVTATLGVTFARFRLDSTGGLAPTGVAADGEVEDYQVTITASTDLAITKVDDGLLAAPAKTTVYTLVTTNNGPNDATGVTITETVPVGTTFDSNASSVGWVCTPDGNAGSTCTFDVGALANGSDSGGILFAVLVDDPLSGITQIDNTASVAGNETDLIAGNDSDSAVTISTTSPVDDIDGDGIPNDEDDDDDGDGIKDKKDNDQDGDGVNDDVDLDPEDPTVLGPGGMPGVGALSIRKMRLKLDFDDANKDRVTLRGVFPVMPDFDPAGATATLDIGGVGQTFTLNAKGRGVSGRDIIKFKVKKKLAGPGDTLLAKWTIVLRKRTFTIQDIDAVVLDGSNPGTEERILSTTLTLNDGTEDVRYNVGKVTYKSTVDSGKAKNTRP